MKKKTQTHIEFETLTPQGDRPGNSTVLVNPPPPPPVPNPVHMAGIKRGLGIKSVPQWAEERLV